MGGQSWPLYQCFFYFIGGHQYRLAVPVLSRPSATGPIGGLRVKLYRHSSRMLILLSNGSVLLVGVFHPPIRRDEYPALVLNRESQVPGNRRQGLPPLCFFEMVRGDKPFYLKKTSAAIGFRCRKPSYCTWRLPGSLARNSVITWLV